MTCPCSDTATVLWCRGRGHNRRSLRSNCPSISSSSIFATLGPCTALGDVTEVRIPNRIVRWVTSLYGSGRERIEYVADRRHAELIIHQLGVSCSSRSVSTTQCSTALTSFCIDRLRISRGGSTGLAVSITGTGTDASTDSWKLGGSQTTRQILDRTWTVDPGVCATNRGTVPRWSVG